MELQEKVKKTKEYLKNQYGINNNDELGKAIQKTPKINIGVFVNDFWKAGV